MALVSYADSYEDVNERGIKSLLLGSRALRCNNLFVVTWDYEGEKKVGSKKIKFVPLWKWLLGD